VQREQADRGSADVSPIVGGIGEAGRSRSSPRKSLWSVTKARSADIQAESAQKANATPLTRFTKRKTVSQPIVASLMRLWDASWIFASAQLGICIYAFIIRPGYTFYPMRFVLIGFVAAFASSATFNGLGLYEFAEFAKVGSQTQRILAGWTAIVLLGLSVAFLTKTSAHYSRIWLVTWWAIGALGLAAGRVAVGWFHARWTETGRLQRRAAIVGGAAEALRLADDLRAGQLQIIGIFDDQKTRTIPESADIERLGGVESLVESARTTAIDEIIIALPCNAVDRITHLTKELRAIPADIRLWIDMPARKCGVKHIEYCDGLAMATLLERPVKHWEAVYKRLTDVILSTAALIALAWVFSILAAAIKLESRGPVLFKQRRFGFNGTPFEILKFRTMYSQCTDHDAEQLTMRSDRRVTRVGRLLRRFNLDELPQLINVIKGDMSLVGPRPHPARAKAGGHLYADAVEEYAARFRVKPGMTGWAQVNGWRGETDTVEKLQKRVEHDLFYIENWSLGFDLRILFLTAVRGFIDKNAY